MPQVTQLHKWLLGYRQWWKCDWIDFAHKCCMARMLPGEVELVWEWTGAKTIKKNTNSTQNKSQTHRAKQYEVTSFLSTDCELSTETCSKNVYSLGPRSNGLDTALYKNIHLTFLYCFNVYIHVYCLCGSNKWNSDSIYMAVRHTTSSPPHSCMAAIMADKFVSLSSSKSSCHTQNNNACWKAVVNISEPLAHPGLT